MNTPLGWESRTLGSLGIVLRGKGIKRSDVRTTGVPCVRYGELYTEYRNYISTTRSFVDAEIAATSQSISRGDLLFAGSGETREEIGMCAAYVGDSQAVAGGDIVIVRGGTFNPIFLASLCNSPSVVRQKSRSSQGDAVVHIYPRGISDIVIALPPKAEQESIANAILDADTLIATLERLIAKKRAIKQGMMQQLLTGRTRLPGFTAGWQSVALGELGTFLKGRGVKRDDVRSSGVSCIRYGELYTGFSNYTYSAKSFVTDEVAATALPIFKGDLLFAGSGETRDEIGLCVAYVGENAAVAGGDIVVLRGVDFNPIFLATLTNLPIVAKQKARAGQGDAVVHISSRALSEIMVSIPEKPEQDAIAEVLVDADQELVRLRARLTKARAMKTGMMQQLLTGRVRLPMEASA